MAMAATFREVMSRVDHSGFQVVGYHDSRTATPDGRLDVLGRTNIQDKPGKVEIFKSRTDPNTHVMVVGSVDKPIGINVSVSGAPYTGHKIFIGDLLGGIENERRQAFTITMRGDSSSYVGELRQEMNGGRNRRVFTDFFQKLPDDAATRILSGSVFYGDNNNFPYTNVSSNVADPIELYAQALELISRPHPNEQIPLAIMLLESAKAGWAAMPENLAAKAMVEQCDKVLALAKRDGKPDGSGGGRC